MEIDDTIEGLKKGSNIILIGPPMSGKEAILSQIMYSSATKNENAVIVVTTREPAIHILERFKENKLYPSLSALGFVDCVSKTLGNKVVETENIKLVDGPGDLTGIGVKISQFFEDFFIKKNIRKIQLHIDSLSTILMYSNIQVLFRFLHVFTCRIKMAGALGVYVIDSGVHDDQEIATIKQLCDGVIEVKSENNVNFIRIVGIYPKPTSWFEYEINKPL